MADGLGCKVLLVSLYSSDAIGLRYISANLKKNGCDVDLVFFKEKILESDTLTLPTDEEYGLFFRLVRDLRPDVVGISLRSAFFRTASVLTKKIQAEFQMPVVWGGTHPNIAPEECLKIADLICLGEGEFVMMELAQRISAGQDYSALPGLWVRKGEGIIRNPIRESIRDLDHLPYPDYGHQRKYLIEQNRIMSGDPILGRFNLDFLASRGCPYHCAFCCNSIFLEQSRGSGPIVRRRSVDNIIDEIEALKKKFVNLKRIDFIDEVFVWDRAWSSEFASKYARRIGLPFQCNQHPNMVNREILKMLKGAGLERVTVGIQSGSERICRDVYDRPISNEAMIKTGQLLYELRITPTYDLIVDNPFEDDDDRMKTLELLLRLPRPFLLRMFPLTYFPNTPLTRRALDRGFITEDRVESRAERTHSKWFVTMDYPWSRLQRFWISLYSLTSKSFIPKRFIRWLTGRAFLRKNPLLLSNLATLSNNIKLAMIAFKWFGEGKSFKTILRQRKRGQGHWQI